MNDWEIDDERNAVPFTARLIAHYRAMEAQREDSLFVDPFAERLAGDMTRYFSEHAWARGTNDYVTVRTYYIDTQLLIPWCRTHEESQIVLLGAGLDARAYRFEPLKENDHTIIEVDFDIVNSYKADILKEEKPLCNLVRVSADLSDPTWTSQLKSAGFSEDSPTFWLLEGVVYYLDVDRAASILKAAARSSTDDSKVFVDVCVPGLTVAQFGPFMRHFKWGLNIEEAPSFFAHCGWKVTCAYADSHDLGRDVGQRNLIFVTGVRDLSMMGSPLDLFTELEPMVISESERTTLALDLFTSIMPEIEGIVKSYIDSPEEGKTRYLRLIDQIKPTLQKIIKSHDDLLSIGHISARLFRDPSTVICNSPEEEEAHIVGYLTAIALLMYCTIKGVDGWEFTSSSLYQDSLKIQGNINALPPYLHRIDELIDKE